MVDSESETKEGSGKDVAPKKRVPGEGDVISGGGLSAGKKYVVDDFDDETPGIRTVTVHQLSPDGTFDPSSKKEEFSIVINGENTIDVEKLRFHNKMKKKFVRKGES